MKNILICSAGRRVELVEAFREQAHALIPGAAVHAIDSKSHLSSACQVADYSSSCPRISDTGYEDFLLDYALSHDIALVIPTIDTELAPLALEKERFKKHGIQVVVSSQDLVTACRDKRRTGEIFRSLGVDYPEIYPRDHIQLPCFAKPYDGSCSIGARVVRASTDLTEELLSDEKMIFMELINQPYVEYTIDAFFSRGILKCLVPRKRLEVRAGEVSKGLTVRSWLYTFLLDRLATIKGAVGCLTIQVFANDEQKHCIGLEINPRFGGGYPLAYAAGANYPGWLIREHLLGEEVVFFDTWKADLLMLRYDSKVLVPNVRVV